MAYCFVVVLIPLIGLKTCLQNYTNNEHKIFAIFTLDYLTCSISIQWYLNYLEIFSDFFHLKNCLTKFIWTLTKKFMNYGKKNFISYIIISSFNTNKTFNESLKKILTSKDSFRFIIITHYVNLNLWNKK